MNVRTTACLPAWRLKGTQILKPPSRYAPNMLSMHILSQDQFTEGVSSHRAQPMHRFIIASCKLGDLTS